MSDSLFDKALEPMLIASEKPAFNDKDFIYELKLDGTRALVYLDQDTKIFNKRRLSLQHKFPELKQLHTYVKHRCILDGELFVYHDNHVDFFASQKRSLLSDRFKIQIASEQIPASFTAFDILYDKDRLVIDEPLMKRKQRLARLIKKEDQRFSVSRYIEEDGISLFELTTKQSLEGIVAKRKDSLYYPGKRTKDWIKCKNWLEDDYVICGYIEKEKGIISFVIGQYDNRELIYKGHVTMGTSLRFFEAHQPQKSQCPFKTVPSGNENAVWLKPTLVCVVAYMEKTPQDSLRQPICRGIRTDKKAEDCIIKK